MFPFNSFNVTTWVSHKLIFSSWTAYLLFCGCTIGSHFGSNQCIVLEGQIDNIGIMNEYTICSKLYEVVETSLRINVPYRNAAEYDIWMSEERPSHQCKIIAVSGKRSRLNIYLKFTSWLISWGQSRKTLIMRFS